MGRFRPISGIFATTFRQLHAISAKLGPYRMPSTAGTFRKKFWKNSGKTPETLSELFLEFPSRVRLGPPKPYNSMHLKPPEHFQNCLPLNTAGDASFFRSGAREGLSELLMEAPAVLRIFWQCKIRTKKKPINTNQGRANHEVQTVN